MTNADIIFAEGQRLAKEGLIQYTGREFKAVDAEGKEFIVRETEPIHTFAHWKELGFSVKKGQHAITKIVIWKYKVPNQDEDGVLPIDNSGGDMFMKTAHFFSLSQVERKEA